MAVIQKTLPSLDYLQTDHLKQLVPLVQWVSLSIGAPRAWLTVQGKSYAFKVGCNGTIVENLSVGKPLLFKSRSVGFNQTSIDLDESAYLDSEPASQKSHRVCGWGFSIEKLEVRASIGLAFDNDLSLHERASEIVRLATSSISNSLCQLYEIACREPLILRATQAKLELALAASHIGIIEYDFSSRHIAFDKQLGQIYGYQKAVRGPTEQLWMNRLHPDDLTQAVAALRHAVPDASGQARIDTEYRIIALDGTVRDLQAKGLIQFNTQGKPDHLIGAQWDVTEQKQIQRALSGRNAQLQDAYDYIELAKNGVGIGVGDYDIAKGVLNCDAIAAGLFELHEPMTEAPYAAWTRLLAPDVLERVVAESRIALKDPTKSEVRLQYPIDLKDGRRRELQWIYRIFRDGKGHATRLLGCVWDVTQEVESRRALERMQSMLLEMEELGNIGAWAYDPKTGLIDWTGQIHRIVASNLSGPMRLEDATRFYMPESRLQILAAFREAKERGTGWDLVLELETEEKVRKWVHTRGKAIQKPDGTITRLIGSVRDVTQEVDGQRQRLQQQAQLQSCLDNMQVGILVFSPEQLVFANASFRQIIGLEAENSLVDVRAFDITHRKDHKFLARRYAKVLEGEASADPLVIDIYALDGSSTSCLTTIAPITWNGRTHILASVAPLRESDMVRTVIRAAQERYDKLLIKDIDKLQFSVARELHDLVGSKLAGVSMALGGLAARDGALQADIAIMQKSLEEATESSRTLARGLMPVDSAPGSFWRALERTCKEHSALSGISCKFTMRGRFDDVSPESGGHLYRIALEAMSNAFKHGKAKTLDVNLKRRRASCLLEVVDHGQGMGEGPLEAQTGIGMKSMQARARAIDGIVTHSRNKFGGVTVAVEWVNQKAAPNR